MRDSSAPCAAESKRVSPRIGGAWQPSDGYSTINCQHHPKIVSCRAAQHRNSRRFSALQRTQKSGKNHPPLRILAGAFLYEERKLKWPVLIKSGVPRATLAALFELSFHRPGLPARR